MNLNAFLQLDPIYYIVDMPSASLLGYIIINYACVGWASIWNHSTFATMRVLKQLRQDTAVRDLLIYNTTTYGILTMQPQYRAHEPFVRIYIWLLRASACVFKLPQALVYGFGSAERHKQMLGSHMYSNEWTQCVCTVVAL